MNVIKHKHGDIRVREGDLVSTPKGKRKVIATSYSERQGARIWVKDPTRVGNRDVFSASECECYVTSED